MDSRGPDDEGYWRDERCAMAFRRLSILDLSRAGNQPMLTPDGRHVLVFNGEVYNFRELRHRLEGRGIQFRSDGDSEVVLQALAEWGEQALTAFNGMFALAFYDRSTQQLLLARDHAGIKPLYFVHTDEGIAFASQYNQILRHPFTDGKGISQDVLGLYLRFGYLHAPYALIEKTYQVEPGQWVKVDQDGERTVGRYYAFPSEPHPSPFRNGEAPEALEAALDSAVRRQLVSDVPVGVFLSGGIDSPLVAATAQRYVSSPLKAFTIGVPNSADDESEAARHFAGELGLEHIMDWADPDRALDQLDDVIEASNEPTADYSIFPTLLVSRLARNHVKVVLSGDGGDELFWGYPSRFGTTVEQAPYYRLPRPFRLGCIAARKVLGVGGATRESLWSSVGRLYQKKQTIFLEEDLDALFPELPGVPEEISLFDFDRFDQRSTASWVRWNEFYLHLARILTKVDRASMHHSLEVRVPLLDKDVIDVAARMSWEDCLDVRSRVGKLPLRRALHRRVAFQEQKKKGFTVPMHKWLAGPLQPLMLDYLLGRRELLGQPLDAKVLQRLNDQLLSGNRYKAWGLWLLLSLALWEERHLRPAQQPVLH